MRRRKKLQVLALLALGGLLGYLAAAGKLGLSSQAAANLAEQLSAGDSPRPQTLLAGTEPEAVPHVAQKGKGKRKLAAAATAGKKPNILVIWGDDVGYWNVSAYNRG